MLPVNFLLFIQIILFLFITPGSPRVLVVSYAMTYGMKKT
ncbi:MAG: threonine transporter RhtB, partial [Rickettsiales bacterium]|nr:threonine transporter RhtB [Rickettsiales bacterium]